MPTNESRVTTRLSAHLHTRRILRAASENDHIAQCARTRFRISQSSMFTLKTKTAQAARPGLFPFGRRKATRPASDRSASAGRTCRPGSSPCTRRDLELRRAAQIHVDDLAKRLVYPRSAGCLAVLDPSAVGVLVGPPAQRAFVATSIFFLIGITACKSHDHSHPTTSAAR